MPYTVERTGADVLTLRHDPIAAGWEQRYLLMADVHFDSPHCDRHMLTRHLQEAQRCGAGVLCLGDWFDAMCGRNDPRRSKSDTRGGVNRDNYLDLLVDDSAAYLEPYRAHLVMLADGNHETAIRRNVETDLLDRLCAALGVPHMGYSGFVRYLFQRQVGGRTQRVLYWHHGGGGGGPVTRGTIATSRRAVVVPDADIVAAGHIHEAWNLEVSRLRCNIAGQVRIDRQLHIQLPTYKQEHVLHGGYHIEKERPPKPLGAWWLVFRYRDHAYNRVEYTAERAL